MLYHSFEMPLAGATTFKKRYLWTVAVIAIWIAVHVILRSVSPSFEQGPPGPARSPMSQLFRLEWLGHFVVFGIAVTAIRNRVGWWRKPTYGMRAYSRLKMRQNWKAVATKSCPRGRMILDGLLAVF